jgi:hypothetical protein
MTKMRRSAKTLRASFMLRFWPVVSVCPTVLLYQKGTHALNLL